VRDNPRGPGIIVRIVAENGEYITLAFESRAEADPFLWALAVTVSPYESLSLDAFEIISPLGAGAFGKVYLVRDVRTNERLALKVLHKDLVFSDKLHFNSAVNERLTLELVCGHPFLATLRYATQTAHYLYLVTDFYEGGDLFNFLRSHHESMREAHAIRIIAEVVLGLEAMHAMRLVYRDLKPENILLDSDGHVRIADLGLAKLLTPEASFLTSTICGSLVYAGPEMLAGEKYGISFDQWTLGVFIYQVLTGEVPFHTDEGKIEDILIEQRTGVIERGVLSIDAYSLVKQLLTSDPARRPTCQQIQTHPFFKDIDWPALEAKEPHEHSLSSIMHNTAARSLEELPLAQRAVVMEAADDGEVETCTKEWPPRALQPTTAASDAAAAAHHDRVNQFLLRHFDPDEWSNMSFSDASDGVSVSDAFRGPFAAADHDDETRRALETRMIPGWNFHNRTGNWRPARYPKPSTHAIEDGVRRPRSAWKERWQPSLARALSRRCDADRRA
jgi:serine/threonine protein kinase